MSKRKPSKDRPGAPDAPGVAPSAPAEPMPPWPSDAWIDALAARVERASKVLDDDARRSLSRTYAEQVARHRLLTERDLRGELSPEVGRTMPAVSRQIRDLARELGITEKRKPGGGFFGGGES